VTIKNARGKGARHVIDWTGRQIANADYDVVAAMLDTDQDWSPAVAKLAKSKKILVLASEPCSMRSCCDCLISRPWVMPRH